jgi:DNA-binding transcriptional ArsR family regulator
MDQSVGSGVPVVSVDGVLGALGDSTRRTVVELLAAGGGRTATSLAGELPVTRQAVVQHLAVLREAGLVESRRVGRDVRFELRSQALNETAAWIADVAAQWDRRLAVIAEIAETVQIEAMLSAESPAPTPELPGDAR